MEECGFRWNWSISRFVLLPPPRGVVQVLTVELSVAICEINNQPSNFVHTNPYFVVNQLDWIQCRYLLVQRGPGFVHHSFPFPILLLRHHRRHSSDGEGEEGVDDESGG